MTTSTTDPAVRQQGRIGAAAARSWLLVPADKPHRFADAEQVGADALILDLEDGVAAPNKPQARRSARDWLDHGGHAWVRINSVDETNTGAAISPPWTGHRVCSGSCSPRPKTPPTST